MCEPASIAIAASTVVAGTIGIVNSVNASSRQNDLIKAQKKNNDDLIAASKAAEAAQQAPIADPSAGQTALDRQTKLARLRMGLASTIKTKPQQLVSNSPNASPQFGAQALPKAKLGA